MTPASRGLAGAFLRAGTGSDDRERAAKGQTMTIDTKGLEWAVKFHELYERLAPDYGYETRTETRQFESESKNGRLMIAVCGELIPQAEAAAYAAGAAQARADERERVLNIATVLCVPFAEGIHGYYGRGYLDALKDYVSAIRASGEPRPAAAEAGSGGERE